MHIGVVAADCAAVIYNAWALRFVMREVGNGVLRAESAAIVLAPSPLEGDALGGYSALGGEWMPPAMLDLAIAALRSLGDAALTYVLLMPPRGTAMYVEPDVTAITLRVASVY